MKITSKQYAQTIFDLTDGKSKPEIEKSLADFASYLRKERKLKFADKIIEQFGKMFNQKNGIIEAEVSTAKKISSAVEKKVKEYIEKKYSTKSVDLKNTIDESIKGGIIVRVGDEVMDNSVSGRINKLKQELTK